MASAASGGCDRPCDCGDAEDAAVPAETESEGVDSARVAGEIRAMLTASAASWNAGDLEGFLDDYSDEPGLTFVGGEGVIRGLEEVRERYLRTYWAPGSQRDSLRFEAVEVRPLGDGHALAVGRYVLYRPPAGDVTGTGRFSLVLRSGEAGWTILHDHSSADPGADGGA